jgi:hypothetical protein
MASCSASPASGDFLTAVFAANHKAISSTALLTLWHGLGCRFGFAAKLFQQAG